MKVNNEIAQAIVAEMHASAAVEDAVDMLARLHNGETRGKRSEIAAECLKRVMPDITPDEYKKVASDVLRWYVDGDCLAYECSSLNMICPHH
jgi:hypothetical protein